MENSREYYFRLFLINFLNGQAQSRYLWHKMK